MHVRAPFIWIIESPSEQSGMVRTYLIEKGVRAAEFYSTRDALLRLQKETPDLILLTAVNAEDMAPWSILSTLRREACGLPVLILLHTAGGYRLNGLDLGTDVIGTGIGSILQLLIKGQAVLAAARTAKQPI